MLDFTVLIMVAAALGCGWFWGREWERGAALRSLRKSMRQAVAELVVKGLRGEGLRAAVEHGEDNPPAPRLG